MEFIADTFYKNNAPNMEPIELVVDRGETYTIPPFKEDNQVVVAKSIPLKAEYTMEIKDPDLVELQYDEIEACKPYDDSWYFGKFDAQVCAKEFCLVAKNLYDVEMDEGWIIGWMANAYEKGRMEEEKRSRPNCLFNIGDVVVLTKSIIEEDIELAPAGTIGEIISFYTNDEFDCHLFIPSMEDGLAVRYDEIELNPIQQQLNGHIEASSLFGHRVQITSGSLSGEIGTIVARDTKFNQDAYHIKLDNEPDSLWYMRSEFDLMPTEIENTTTPEVGEIIPF